MNISEMYKILERINNNWPDHTLTYMWRKHGFFFIDHPLPELNYEDGKDLGRCSDYMDSVVEVLPGALRYCMGYDNDSGLVGLSLTKWDFEEVVHGDKFHSVESQISSEKPKTVFERRLQNLVHQSKADALAAHSRLWMEWNGCLGTIGIDLVGDDPVVRHLFPLEPRV